MGQFNVSLLGVLICFLLFEFRLNYCNKKYNLGTSVRSKIKKIETAMINTLQWAARKNLIQMSLIAIVTVILGFQGTYIIIQNKWHRGRR
jgi:hypothetical protein